MAEILIQWNRELDSERARKVTSTVSEQSVDDEKTLTDNLSKIVINDEDNKITSKDIEDNSSSDVCSLH